MQNTIVPNAGYEPIDTENPPVPPISESNTIVESSQIVALQDTIASMKKTNEALAEELKSYKSLEIYYDELKKSCDWVVEKCKILGGVKDFYALKYLIDIDNQGRLCVLPCDIGDTYYVVGNGKADEYTVKNFIVSGKDTRRIWVVLTNGSITLSYDWNKSIGKDFFRTRWEVEARMKED